MAVFVYILLFGISFLEYGNALPRELKRHIVSSGLHEAGFEDFEVTSLYEIIGSQKTRFNMKTLHRRRRSLEELSHQLHLELPAFEDTLHLSMKPVKSPLHPQAEVITTHGDVEHVWEGEHPDCFLSGRVTSHGGSVAMSHCDDLLGVMATSTHEYQISTIPRDIRRSITGSDEHSLLLSRRTLGSDSDLLGDGLAVNLTGPTVAPNNDPPHSFNVESAVVIDAAFTKLLNTNDTSRRLQKMLLKYTGVQEEWSRSDMLGYDVTIQIKYMNFYDVNPSWFNTVIPPNETHIPKVLKNFCHGTQNLPHDHAFLHTGEKAGFLGLSYVGGACKHTQRCGFESSKKVLTYIATAHETGHALGMAHDNVKGCTFPDTGCMGGRGAGWSTCSRKSLDHLLRSGHADCLFQENVHITSHASMPQVEHLVLTKQLLGQLHTPDEVCALTHDTGFRFRPYPKVQFCRLFSCVNMNPGPHFGQMFRHSYNIAGQYCGDGKICHKDGCVTWADALQYNLTVRAGGWSAWSDWQLCTRTCGTGVTFRQRTCTNPTPMNHETCDGNRYEANTCNSSPCAGDSSDQSTLIKQRGSEKCAELIQNGVLNETEHLPDGDRYSSQDELSQCELSCKKVEGHKDPSFFRFGLLPDGTPCDASLEMFDVKDWPLRKGFHGHCVQGSCIIKMSEDSCNDELSYFLPNESR